VVAALFLFTRRAQQGPPVSAAEAS
jgi:hypothetical protein